MQFYDPIVLKLVLGVKIIWRKRKKTQSFSLDGIILQQRIKHRGVKGKKQKSEGNIRF